MKTVAGMVAGSKKPVGIKYSTMIKNRNLPKDIGVIGGNFRTSKWETADALMNLESLPNVDRLTDMLVFCDKQ